MYTIINSPIIPYLSGWKEQCAVKQLQHHHRLHVMLKEHVCDSLTLLRSNWHTICPDLTHTHTHNPFHSFNPLPVVLVAVINISQVYESFLSFVPVEKQTARSLSGGAICVPLLSGVCRFSLVCAALWRALHEKMLRGAPCLSYQCYLQMKQRRLKVIMKLEVFHHALVERVKRKRVQ